MKKIEDVLISKDATILEAVKCIDKGSVGIALVVDEAQKLLGTVTDGDIRRGLLKGISMEDCITKVMYTEPLTISSQTERDNVYKIMDEKRINCVPILGPDGIVIGAETRNEYIGKPKEDNIVFLMAGGLGSRLQPLTNDTPKPLIPIGERPILETIMSNFIQFGFKRFYISINYRGEMIREHFGDGSKFGAEISYIEETEQLGTAGSLSLLPEKPKQPIIVMNGDILTSINFQQLLAFHHHYKASATMCVREFNFQVPYGVVTTEDHALVELIEKPNYNFFVNAGIYVIAPDVVDLIPKGVFFDMPTLFKEIVKQEKGTLAFPLREYWIDIGQHHDLEKAKQDFGKYFNYAN